MAESKHVWKFVRAGGLDQVMIESPEDLAHLGELDPKLWVALSCPVKGLEFDEKTLEMIDSDKDGRIRVPEVVEAVNFALARLKMPAVLLDRNDGLPLAAINDGAETGKLLIASAKRSMAEIGESNAAMITVPNVTTALDKIPKARYNGDGVVPAASADDDETRAIIADMVKTVGGDADLSGEAGASEGKLSAFIGALKDYADWWQHGKQVSEGTGGLPAGVDAQAAYTAFTAVKDKIDDYFRRCAMATFDPRASETLDKLTSDYTAAAAKDIAEGTNEVGSLPLQQIGPQRPLDLQKGVNPSWKGATDAFSAAVVVPMLGSGTTSIGEAQWAAVKAGLAPYATWLAGKKGSVVEPLGIERIQSLLAMDIEVKVRAAIARDLEPAPEFAVLHELDRLVRYKRDLFKLLCNFVNFAEFYDKTILSIFDAGTLYLDQRSCDLCIRVTDVGGHSSLATLSRMYLAYCACTRPTGESMTIVAAFTQGDSDYLMVGRRGLFFDRTGKDWDAQITKLIENPISLRQAFWSPYKRMAKFIQDQAEKFAASKDKAVTDNATSKIATAASDTAAGAKKEAFDIAKFAGIFAAIGLALGAIGGAFAALATAFVKLVWWQMPLALLGVLLVISGPSVLLAWLKLRTRTLGPVLEGNGWAINGRIKVNIPLGTSLTSLKKLPSNSRLSLDDPFEDKGAKRRKIIMLAILIAAALGTAAWFLYGDVITEWYKKTL